MVSDYGPANNLEISTTPTLVSMLLNAVSPPSRKPGDQVNARVRGYPTPPGWGALMLTTGKGATLVSNPLIVLSGSEMPPPPQIPPRPVPASGLLTRLVFPLPRPHTQNHEIKTWQYRTERSPLRTPLPHGLSALEPCFPRIHGVLIA